MRIIDIYTDGSHLDKQHNGRLGCGGIMVERDQSGKTFGLVLGQFGKELTPEYMRQEYGSDQCSNPTAEMVGLLCALEEFNIPKDAKVIIHADYTGVKEWMEGNWRVKEPYLKKVKEKIDKIIKERGLVLSYEWVKAHQAGLDQHSYWNNQVDVLAKGM